MGMEKSGCFAANSSPSAQLSCGFGAEALY